MENNYTNYWGKMADTAILISEQTVFNLKKVLTDKYEHHFLIRGTIDQEILTLINIYVPGL